MKLRRSIIYNYGFGDDLEERTQGYINGASDCILFDLEDGVAAVNKARARKETGEMLKKLDYQGKERVVRVNGVDTEYYPLDMKEAIAVGLPDAVRVPKCDTVEDVLKVDADLAAIEKAAGLEPNTIEIWAMIESPIGIRNAYDIAVSIPRLTALTIGMEDLHRALGMTRRYIDNDLDLLYARQKLVLDAKAAGVQVLDTPLLLDNDELNQKFTISSQRMGFDGRAVHNEREAEFCNKTYYPAPEVFEWAERAVVEYEKQSAEGHLCVMDGKIICATLYGKAKDILARKK